MKHPYNCYNYFIFIFHNILSEAFKLSVNTRTYYQNVQVTEKIMDKGASNLQKKENKYANCKLCQFYHYLFYFQK